MSEQNNIQRICANGHQSRDAAARFCITCGAPLSAAAKQPPAQPQPPIPVAAPPIVQQVQPPPVNPYPQPNYPQPNQPPAGANQYPPNHYPPQPPIYPPQAQYPPPNYPPNGNQPPPGNWGQYPPQNYQPQPQNYLPQPQPNYQQYQPQPQYLQPAPPYRPPGCHKCGGDGGGLPAKVFVCDECRWLRPLAPNYQIDPAAFQWAEDGKAMGVLRSITPLNAAAKSISHTVGRRWIEVTLNGVLLGEKQLPDIYFQAVRAARILGVTHMPDVYVSGEYAWDCHTYGSDKDAFIVIGSALASSFSGADMSFILAREMGHVRAGHALWKSVLKFLVGEQQQHKSIMSGGILAALSPSALLESAFEMPLLGWARQAEITADRAGMLAVGDEEVARRVLLSWSLKSAFLYRRINVAAWLEQQADSDDGATKLSELVSTSTPYITRRLTLMEKFARSDELKRWRELISKFAPPLRANAPPNAGQPARPNAAPPKPIAGQLPPPANVVVPALPAAAKTIAPPKKAVADEIKNEIKMKCPTCGTPMRIPRKVLQDKPQVHVRCPNAACAKVVTLKQKPAAASSVRRDEERGFSTDTE